MSELHSRARGHQQVLRLRDRAAGRDLAPQDAERCTACWATTARASRTLIKTLAGVHQPTDGLYLVDGAPVRVQRRPRDALDRGIATVYQDLALVPLMCDRAQFLPRARAGAQALRHVPRARSRLHAKTAHDRLSDMGTSIRDAEQVVGTLSGGERQCLAIVRAIHFGARVLILDEPTAALGVKQTVERAQADRQARAGAASLSSSSRTTCTTPTRSAIRFTVLNRGQSLGTFPKSEIEKDALLDMMAGGMEMQKLMADLEGVRI